MAKSEIPLVSIVVPVYNGEKYLRESLDSIVNQTYSNIEVLVMDDASTDGTPEIIKSYGDKLQCIRQKENRGIYQNSNDGIKLAKGELIAVYHSDDIYLPNIVEKEVQFLNQYPNAGAVFCMSILIDEDNREYHRLKIPSEVRGGIPLPYAVIFNALLKYKNIFLVCPSSMVRKSVHHDVGVYRDEIYKNSSDLDMWIRISQKYQIGILEEYLIQYRRTTGQSSRKYRQTRMKPERYFRIMDYYLQEGGRKYASPDALAGYKAHYAEERLMLVVKHYIKNHLEDSKEILKKVPAWHILGSRRIQRYRLFVLFIMLHVLVRLPRIKLVAEMFILRWHFKS